METHGLVIIMSIRLYDSLSRSTKVLCPQGPLRFYCCGPTVYGPAHIGNFRTFLLQDVLRRALEMDGMPVFHIRNITDVDDKTIRASQAQGIPLSAFTQKWTDRFHKDGVESLNMLPPHKEPRATEHIAPQIAMIQTLMDKGHAYRTKDGSVYFKISSFPDYGQLSGLEKRTLKQQPSHDSDEYDRETASDFALWKSRKTEDGPNFWPSPWGEGRPGWHIECSAMSTHYLGNSFELHGGGIDLCFPHHENEIAQSECATGEKPFVKHWFHCAHLKVEGEKMSKSLGNLYTVEDIEKKGYSATALRYLLLSGHYGQPFNFTFHGLQAAQSATEKLSLAAGNFLSQLDQSEEKWRKTQNNVKLQSAPWGPFLSTWNALENDLNTPAAFGETFKTLNGLKASLSKEETAHALLALHKVLWVLGLENIPFSFSVPGEIQGLAEERWKAKLRKDFSLADKLRKKINEKGWTVLDGKSDFKLKPIMP